ncbi:death domain-associated protein 6-like isoform X2 [Anneissia japonica]|uniref:death domain-associated protein 6-like isoform X2 n=1 Tax=Anneissia japonica TaxID=1529436 RepID=UPI0014256B57|nr:death domain-associated protein 6-like isoform X2 [Anneissia japonica]
MSENEIEDKSKKIFNKFIDAVKDRIQPDKQVSIPAFLRKKYEKAAVKYTSSKDFQHMILEHLINIRKRKGSIYTHIHEVVGILNASKQKNGEINSKSNSDHKYDELEENTGEGTSVDDETNTKSRRKKQKKQKRRVKKLELHLKELSKEIKRLGEKELTLEDMDDEESDHIMEHRLKLRFNRVWEKLCELKGLPPSTGRVTEQYLIFEGTRFKEINQKLEKLMNSSEFPNFKDILVVVRKVNKRKSLNLSDRELSDIAETSFKTIGNRLQQRREVDLAYNFGSHVTESFKIADDPARSDPELNKKLKENHKLGKERLDKWISKCSEKQDLGEDYATGSSHDEPPTKRIKKDSSSESSDESEKEDEEDDNEDEDEDDKKLEEEIIWDDNLDDELEGSTSEDEEEVVTSSIASSEVNTEDEQFLPDQNTFSYQKSVENDSGVQCTNIVMANPSTQMTNPSNQVVNPNTKVANSKSQVESTQAPNPSTKVANLTSSTGK